MSPFEQRKILLGSDRGPVADSRLRQPHPEEEVTVAVRLRRAQMLDARDITRRKQFLTRAEYAQQHSAAQADVDLIYHFASAFGLEVIRVDKQQRLVYLRSSVAQMEKAFSVHLHKQDVGGNSIMTRVGPILIPAELDGIVRGVFGMDLRPCAFPQMRFAKGSFGPPFGKPKAFDGQKLASIYDFPKNSGTGQTIALIELGGGFRQTDIQAFFSSLGIPAPKVTSVSVLGATNNPGVDLSADVEVALDIQVAGAVAPQANIVVYFAPNTDQGFLQAVLAAVHDAANNPYIISISWGQAESEWTLQAMNAMSDAFQTAAALGVSVFCAAGDSGAGDGVSDQRTHVDFPASSPWVTACGGTKLVVSGDTRQETTWNEDADNEGATGGGVSDFFDRPYYQLGTIVPVNLNSGKAGRAIPDVSAVGDPVTGYAVFANFMWQVVGGTSAVAPLFAGLLARINMALAKPAGFINPSLYAAGATSGFNDITIGNNTYGGVTGYAATAFWDATTGFGTPGGMALLNLLAQPPQQPPPPPPVTAGS